MDSETFYFGAAIIGTSLLTLWFYIWLFLKIWRFFVKGDTETKAVAKRLFFFWFAVSVANILLSYVLSRGNAWAIAALISAPLNFARETCPIFLAFWLVWRLKPLAAGEARGAAGADTPVGIKETVEQVFRSEEYLTALRTSLPKGENDTKYGLDYIPFMLQSLTERRRRFDRKASTFFWVTISVGVLFAGIVTYLGYILVNDAAAGTPRDVVQLESTWDRAQNTLNLLSTKSSQNSVFRSQCSLIADELEHISLEGENVKIRDSVVSAIKGATEVAELAGVRSQISAADKGINKLEKNANALQNKMQAADNTLAEFSGSYTQALTSLSASSTSTSDFLKSVKSNLDKPENRTAEIIKRLSVGVVVASFFIAILRYVASQFRANWNEAITADYEDQALRRFYVALKTAGENEKDRSAVIVALVKGGREAGKGDPTQDFELGKIDSELLKELLGAITKKL